MHSLNPRKYVLIFALSSFAYLLTSAAHSASNHSAQLAFESLIADHWANQLAENPTFATSLGVRDYDEQLPDPSIEAYERSVQKSSSFLDRLNQIDAAQLSDENQLNHALLKLDLENNVAAAEHGGRYMIITNRGGPHLSLTSMVGRLPFFTREDYQSYVTRLAAMPDYLSKATNRIEKGLNAGWVQPCKPMQGYEKSIQTHIVNNSANSVFMQPFKQRPCLLYTSPSPRDLSTSRMPSSA